MPQDFGGNEKRASEPIGGALSITFRTVVQNDVAKLMGQRKPFALRPRVLLDHDRTPRPTVFSVHLCGQTVNSVNLKRKDLDPMLFQQF